MKNLKLSTITTVILASISLQGCLSISKDTDFEAEIAKSQSDIEHIQKSNNYAIVETPKVTFKAVDKVSGKLDVFDNTFVNISNLTSGANLRAAIEMLQKKGLNVIAQNGVNLDIPILNYAIKNSTARRALDMITYDLGMGYHMVKDGEGEPYAVITGLPNLEYRLNIPNETKTLSQFIVNKTKDSSQQVGGQSGGSQSGGSQSGGSQSGGGQSGGDSNSLTSTTDVKSAFWDDTEAFLNSLINEVVLINDATPKPYNQPYMTSSSNSRGGNSTGSEYGSSSNSFSAKAQSVGLVSINRTTGHIYVSAPKHKLDKIRKYLKEIDLLMNSKIIIKGRIIAQTETESVQKGLDVAALAPYCAGSYRCMVTNDVFNNVRITEPTANNWFNAGIDNLVGSSAIGIQALDQTWQVFNAYTEDNSNIRVVGNFEGEAFHGEDITLSDVQNRVNQQLSTNNSVTSDGVTTGGGTSSQLIPYKIGSIITIVPMLDVQNSLVKTKVDVKMSVLGENKAITNVIGDDVQTGYFQSVDNMEFKVSPTLKPGELIIAAGRTQTRLSDSIGGTSGLKDSYVGGLFGKSERLKEKITYYILLQAKVIPLGG